MTRARGFTLLELIVVIAIFGVMAAMAYGGLASVLQSRTRVQESLARLAQYQKAYVRMRDDFQQASSRTVRDNFGDVQPAFLGNRLNDVLFTRGGWRNPLGLARASLERVGYHLDDKGQLVRRNYPVLDRAQDTKPVDVTILTDVQEIHWRYLDPVTRQWSTTWPIDTQTNVTAVTVPPPLAVELTMTTKDLGDLRFLFATGVDPLPVGSAGGTGGVTGTLKLGAPQQGTVTQPTPTP